MAETIKYASGLANKSYALTFVVGIMTNLTVSSLEDGP